MNRKLLLAALATLGLAACGEERAVQSSVPAVSTTTTPVQAAPSAEQSAPATQVAQDNNKDEAKAESEAKSETPKPQDEEKKEESEKKAN